MARKIDLRTGRPVWTAYRAPRVPVRSLRKDLKTDVLIVGMGISGAMMAEALTADGHFYFREAVRIAAAMALRMTARPVA